MKELQLIVTLFFVALVNAQVKGDSREYESLSSIDTSSYTILPFKEAERWILKKRQEAKFESQDLPMIEKLLKDSVNKYNNQQEMEFAKIRLEHPEYKLDKNNFIIDLKFYKRQYVIMTNLKGEKEVWINCFCQSYDQSWKTKVLIAMDGGNCFFNLIINLTTGKCSGIAVNGDA